MRAPRKQVGTTFKSDGSDVGSLLSRMASVSPLNFVSFKFQTLPRRLVLRVIPEIRDFERLFNKADAFHYWHSEFHHHNNEVKRGARMCMSRVMKLPSLLFTNIDTYIHRLRCLEMSKALDCISRFIDRIQPRIQKSPSAYFWRVSGAIVITRDHWLGFCKEVFALLNMLGHHGNAFPPEQRPDYPILLSSAMRLMDLLHKS